jgi:hypothetical protein
MFVRTMFWESIVTLKKVIDGNEYEFSNAANVDHFNCKSALIKISSTCDPSIMEMTLTFETFSSWKKDLIKDCKDWDKLYLKHMKTTYPELNAIHMAAMKPLTLLIDSNNNFHKLENMIKDKREVQQFRYNALETEFCKFLTGVCEIFKEYGDVKDHFDIKQMLKVLKIDKWKEVNPFSYYLMPLQKSIEKVRKNLL